MEKPHYRLIHALQHGTELQKQQIKDKFVKAV